MYSYDILYKKWPLVHVNGTGKYRSKRVHKTLQTKYIVKSAYPSTTQNTSCEKVQIKAQTLNCWQWKEYSYCTGYGGRLYHVVGHLQRVLLLHY